MVKLKDLLNTKTNKRNNQFSLDVRKTKLKQLNISVEDILNMDAPSKNKVI